MSENDVHLEKMKRLRYALAEGFNLDELKSLCFELGIDYEDLGGQGKAGKARELVGYMDRRGLLEELVRTVSRLRPGLEWEMAAPVIGETAPRQTPEETPAGSQSRRVRILFLAANPMDTQPLSLDLEIREIDQALRQSEYRDRFELEQQWAVTVQDLQDHFLRYRPDIVHFSGHGSPNSAIILKNREGFSQPVPPQALSSLFRTLKDNIRCVVLNACFSERQAQAIAEHIDCVVGMSAEIGDEAAVRFAAAFYRALGYGRNVQTAFDLGSGQVQLERLEGPEVPKLIARLRDARQIDFV